MNCANHSENAAVAFCRNCGKALCETCQRPTLGTVFCEEHLPAPAPASADAQTAPPPQPPPQAWATTGSRASSSQTGPQTGPQAAPPPPPPPPPQSNPWVQAPPPGISPGLAFVLGFIPGVGAVYNGQYAKGLIHAVVFGLLVSIESSGSAPGMEPLFGIIIALWVFYMAFEAYHTATKRLRGEVVDEFSSLLPLDRRAGTSGFPVGPVVLIVVGFIFLLNTLEVVRLREVLRFWPVFLIALGGYMLWARLAGGADPAADVRQEAAPVDGGIPR